MDQHAFARTLKRHGLELTGEERDLLFKFYERDRGGTLDYKEFFKGLRGSDFLQTSRSYGFETPDPHYHDELVGGGYGHYFPIHADLPPKTPRAFKAWLQQYSTESCPFATDRKIFGGTWQYRTSQLMRAHPIVSPRYGRTGFPARKTLADILRVISDKISERSTSKFAFAAIFRQFDRNGDGVIDREELGKVLDRYNIGLAPDEMDRLFKYFCTQAGGINYADFVRAIDDYRRQHPLGGYSGTAFGIQSGA
jgi:Ca2+-binding EF-hand superfamily protein